ncbi:MAG: hypothetical protein E7138_02810 [Rikenellaceae bacterium]|nr:hypothetical protein [Rikenellaceae bacterium]
MQYYFDSIEDIFEFGKHKNYSLEEVLVFNPSYLDFCILNIPDFYISENAIKQIQELFPDYIIPKAIESHIFNLEYIDDDFLDDDSFDPADLL